VPAPGRAPEPAVADADDSTALEPVVAESEPAPQPETSAQPEPVVEEPAQAPELGDGQMRILVTYSGDCWTEVTDARGRRLFFGLGTDGRTVELSGEAPFNVLFGNADYVSIRVNGAERAISAAERRGNTARLTIAGS